MHILPWVLGSAPGRVSELRWRTRSAATACFHRWECTVIAIRRFREKDTEPVLDLWERCDIGRPWLDLRAEITEKRKRDRSLFLVAVEGDVVVGSVMGAYDG